jgi:hypothetical protein
MSIKFGQKDWAIPCPAGRARYTECSIVGSAGVVPVELWT